jgi:orotidine-5'-phosphate decarboxylase
VTHAEHFGDRLAAAVQAKNSAVCVGLDPRVTSFPAPLLQGLDQRNLPAVAAATATFCKEVIDCVADVAPVVKPQAAFFELLGPAGMTALSQVIQHAHAAGLLVLLDGKRGDIGSTAEGYAEAYLGAGDRSAWGCDALTVNPYLGEDTLEPFTRRANATGSGIFVLVKTSNPGSSHLQDLAIDGRSIYQRVADGVQRMAHASKGSSGYGNVGAVTGATYPEQLAELRVRMPNTWLLIPGFGAQGGSADDVRAGFQSNGLGAIVNSSRGIIFAYANRGVTASRWQDAVRDAASDMAGQLRP